MKTTSTSFLLLFPILSSLSKIYLITMIKLCTSTVKSEIHSGLLLFSSCQAAICRVAIFGLLLVSDLPEMIPSLKFFQFYDTLLEDSYFVLGVAKGVPSVLHPPCTQPNSRNNN